MDVHIRRPITTGLRLRKVDVLTAQEDGMGTAADPLLLDRAQALQRVLFSQDEDLLREAALRQSEGIPFAGVINAHQQNISVRAAIEDLELIAKASTIKELANAVIFLPFSRSPDQG